jgi:hypothetical protein
VAPSAIPFQDTDTMPVALDKSGIEKWSLILKRPP